MKQTKIKVLSILSFFVYFPLIKPSYLARVHSLNGFYIFMFLISIIIVALRIIAKRKQYKPSKYFLLFCLFMFSLIVSSNINHRPFLDTFNYIFPLIIGVLYMDTMSKEEIPIVLKALSVYLSTIVIINLFTVLLFPNGLYEIYKNGILYEEKQFFLGHNNSAARIIIPAIIVSAIYDIISKKKITIKSFIIALIGLLTVFLTNSVTAIVGIIIVILFMFYANNDIRSKIKINIKINSKVLFILPLLLFVLIVIQNKISMVGFFVQNIFHKDLTLTGRVYIWQYAFNLIERKRWFGYGYGVLLSDLVSMPTIPSSCHNYFLDLLFRGGFVHLSIQILLNYIICKALYVKKNKCSKLLIGFVLSYFIMWQIEVFTNVGVLLMFIVFMLCYKCQYLCKEEGQVNE